MASPLRLGLKNSGQQTTIEALLEVWRIADEAGFDHVWDFDHLATIGAGGQEASVYEGWTLLAAIAQATRRVRFGCMVTGNTYRHPALLAKMAVTVDHLSGGRLEFGIGAAWAEAEHRMFGIEGLEHRVGRLRESLDALISLWTKDRTTLEGRYYRFTDAIANPKPIQKPHPPIWIGAQGESTLRLTARHADVWNISGGDPEFVAEVIKKFDDACAAVGRNPAEVRRSLQFGWDGKDRNELVDLSGKLFELGVTEQVVYLRGDDPVGLAAKIAETLPELRRLEGVAR